MAKLVLWAILTMPAFVLRALALKLVIVCGYLAALFVMDLKPIFQTGLNLLEADGMRQCIAIWVRGYRRAGGDRERAQELINSYHALACEWRNGVEGYL